MTTLAQRLARVHEAIEAARARSHHRAQVQLVGVSKRQPLEKLRQAHAAGLRDFGENYAQELREKSGALAGIRWHFIGPLQSNKVKLVSGSHLVHSVDRAKLLGKFEAQAIAQDVLVQVNIAAEPQKAGIAPAELPALLDRFADLDHVRCRGLMLIPPQGAPEATRRHFADLRALRDTLARSARANVELEHLSMGMSADYAVAVEEGATLVRVGTAIFGPRDASGS
ncbi:MAG: YggS family pyridoxal phosphate-dependent enzyme [Nannocystaceae bacterium]|nr:YggS family pyridoxal phosphate-dependent enzyme [bacterium]